MKRYFIISLLTLASTVAPLTAVFAQSSFIYEKGKSFKDVNASPMPQTLSLIHIFYCLAQQATIPVPKPFQLKWHQAEMGAVFHYDLHVFDGVRYGQGNNLSLIHI